MTERRNPESPSGVTLHKVWLCLILGLLCLSLALNGYILYTRSLTLGQAVAVLDTLRAQLDDLGSQSLSTEVQIDQAVPISATLPFDYVFTVPVDTVYPLSTVVNTGFELPLLGWQDIAVPIQAEIPLQLDLDVPVQAEIPISLTYQLQMTIPIEVAWPPEILSPLQEILREAEDALR
jgi:hypothetical protein